MSALLDLFTAVALVLGALFFLAGVVNPNGLEIAAAVCVACAALELLADRSPVATRSIVRLFRL